MMDDKGQRDRGGGPVHAGRDPRPRRRARGRRRVRRGQDDAKARQVAEHRRGKQREAEMAKTAKVSLDELYQQIQSGEVKELKVVLKADVQGSVEALSDALRRLSTEDVRLNVIHGSVGGITEIGRPARRRRRTPSSSASTCARSRRRAALAEREGVDIRLYTIIYEALNDVREAMEGLLEPTLRGEDPGPRRGAADLHVSGQGAIAGCFVTDGKIIAATRRGCCATTSSSTTGASAACGASRTTSARWRAGYECGIGLESYNDVKVGDIIEGYEIEEVARRLPTPAGRGVAGGRAFRLRRAGRRDGGRRAAPRAVAAREPFAQGQAQRAALHQGARPEHLQRLDRGMRRARPLAAHDPGRESGGRGSAPCRRVPAEVVQFIDGLQLAELGEERVEFLHY